MVHMPTIVHKQIIPEHVVTGRRLGRHVVHHAESRNFPAAQAERIATAYHEYNKTWLPLDQGDIGSCTGNAAIGLLSTLNGNLTFSETDAVSVYSQATALDDDPGSYPPDDTGSAGIYVLKALKQRGYLEQYRHCFGLQHTLATLTREAVILGSNWYDSFDNPDANGTITISPNASVRGGHETLWWGLDAEEHWVYGLNSWGKGWSKDGVMRMSWDTLDRLLHEYGDVATGILAVPPRGMA